MISLFLLTVLTLFTPQSKYPVPRTEHLLFYIQRTHNSNTIVYDANFDKDGNLNTTKPIDAYWLRFDEQGQRMELRTIEKWYVYGVECEKTNNEYDYRMKLAAKGTVKFWLKQTDPFQAEIHTDISGIPSKLDHLYITTDENSLLLKVLHGEFFGTGLESGEKTYYKKIMD